MDSIEKLLGQDVLAADLVKALSIPSSRVLLRGLSGSGKSKIANMVAITLARSGEVVRMYGDAAQAGTRYLAAHRALAGRRLSKHRREAFLASLTVPFRMLPEVGGAAGELAKVAISAVASAKPEFLSAEQQDILSGLQGLGGSGPVTLIVDDVQWLDPETAGLVLALSREETRSAYPFAARLSILFVDNSGAPPMLPEATLRQMLPALVRECRPFPRISFEAVLRAFGLTRSLDANLLDELYAVTGGHLEIAKQLVRLDAGKDLASLLVQGDTTSLMSCLLEDRLKGLDGAAALLRLLRLAACAGSAFSQEEVRCAFMDAPAFEAAFRAACREELLERDGETVRFAHEAIRAAVEQLWTPAAAELHASLAACLRRLRPGDYAARLRHLRLAGNRDGLREVAFALAVSAARGQSVSSPPEARETGDCQQVLDDVREAYRLMDAGEHRQAIDLMMPHYDGGDGLVQGEVVALVGLNLIKLRTRDDYASAAGLLQLWQERRDEQELWQRLMSVLLTAWAFLGEAEQASALYSRLSRELLKAPVADAASRTRLEALNRKADMFFTAEISVKHIRRAVNWFGPPSPDSMPRHGFEHTSALVNLSGALFSCGRFGQAASAAAEALRWAGRLAGTGTRTVEPYKALNNYVISALRAGFEGARELGSALDLLIERGGGLSLDRALLASNRGVLALLGDDLASGLDRLENVWAHVVEGGLDAYYTLYAGSNVAVARALAGNRTGALAVMDEIAPCLDRQAKWLRQAYLRRHAFMRGAISDGGVVSAAVLDGYPATRRPPDGDQDPWWSIGRGLLLSDIQVWSEG